MFSARHEFWNVINASVVTDYVKKNQKQNEAHSARVLILSGGKNIKLRRETVMSKLHTVRLFMEPQWQQQNGVWDE